MILKAPFPYFGGKSMVAHIIWTRLGSEDAHHYIEPFFGSGAVLLNRPCWNSSMMETICDADGHIANVWRALQSAPDQVAKVCDWPVNHADLMARRRVLMESSGILLERLVNDPDYFDVKLAGYWIWGASCWIGPGLTCVNARPDLSSDQRVSRRGTGRIPRITHDQGVSKRGSDSLDNDEQDPRAPYSVHLYSWFRALSERLRHVKVVCGDWTRVCGGNWQDKGGTCAIFFDPPYSHASKRDTAVYAVEDADVALAVAQWEADRGRQNSHRICLAGYEGEHDWLEDLGWTVHAWKTQGGYSNTGKAQDTQGKLNVHRERLWFSPFCLPIEQQQTIFDLKGMDDGSERQGTEAPDGTRSEDGGNDQSEALD